MIFRDRQEAGQELAEALGIYAGAPDTLVAALPRGGVVVGFELSRALRLPLDIVVPRKIADPANPEYAYGAITEDGEAIWGEGGPPTGRWVASVIADEKKESARRLRLYRSARRPRNFVDQTVIIVDDGLATGLTMAAAIKTVKQMQAKKIVLAVPHGARSSLERLRPQVDEVVALATPNFYGAVGTFYQNFSQVSDAEVIELLRVTTL